MAKAKKFSAVVTADPKRRVFIPVPFDPDDVWGAKPKHHVTGSVNGMKVRAVIETFGDARGVILGPAWRRGCGIAPGEKVVVVLTPEGPQRADIAPDVAAALDAESTAGEFFDSLAQFYRKGYLTWIEATKGRPEVRAERLAEVVELCRTGIKQRPR